VSIHGPPRLFLSLRNLKFLNFDFNTDSKPAFHSKDLDPASKNNADPDPQP
jgi:hypothetical protein